MKLVLATICILFSSSAISQLFVGEMSKPNEFQFMQLEVKNDSTFLSFPNELRRTFGFNVLPKTEGTFKVKAGTDHIKFVIKNVNENHINLQTDYAGLTQNIVLKKQLNLDAETEPNSYHGNYIDEKGNRAIVYGREKTLYLMSPYAEQTVSLKPIAKNTFWCASGETTVFSGKTKNKFHNLSITTRYGKQVTLKRSHNYSIKENWVVVDGDSIYINLFIPDLPNKMPACLLLPGGGGQSQMKNFEYEARFFASHGIVSMTFDKTSVGKSKGQNFANFTFKEKVLRYIQLFDYLKTHPQVDIHKVGLHGPSEGGRLALMMGVNLKDQVAFINATATPIMTMKEGQLYAADHFHRNQGVTEEDIISIGAIWKTYYNGIINEKIDTSNFELISELRSKYNRAFLPPPSSTIPLSPKKEDLLDNSVVTDSNKLVCPVLLQYGENDQRVNPNRSIQNFYQNITDSLDVTIEIYPRGNHSMMTPEGLVCSGYAYDKVKWLRKIGIIK